MKPHIRKGKCIWCLKEEPDTSFNNKPHTVSRQLGSTFIGFDICDSCNDYFGRTTKNEFDQVMMSPEVAFKEIFNIIKFLLQQNKNEKSYKEFKSLYFDYHHSKSLIKVRKTFELRPRFLRNFTRQFIRGVYEVFLQEYHRQTENGLDKRFDNIRNFSRRNIGELPLYFLKNNGIYFATTDHDNPSLAFNEHTLLHIDEYGFYQMMFLGHVFFLEVTSRAILTRDQYLGSEGKQWVGNGAIFSGLLKMEYITDLDFTLRSLNRRA